MTANQISYWQLQEDKRHNAASESELARHNRMTETVDMGKVLVSAYDTRSQMEYRNAMTQTGFLNAWSSYMQAQSQQANALVNAYNATTNRAVSVYNAETNRINAQTSQTKVRNDLYLGLADIVNTQNRNNVELYKAQVQSAYNQGRLGLDALGLENDYWMNYHKIVNQYDIDSQKLELSRQQLDVEKSQVTSNIVASSIGSVAKIVGSVSDIVDIFGGFSEKNFDPSKYLP